MRGRRSAHPGRIDRIDSVRFPEVGQSHLVELDQAAPVRRSLLSNTRAYSQSPYGVHVIYLGSTTVRSTTVLTRYMYVPHRGAVLAVGDRRGGPFDTFGFRMTAASEVGPHPIHFVVDKRSILLQHKVHTSSTMSDRNPC